MNSAAKYLNIARGGQLAEFEPLRITDLSDIPEPIPIMRINGEIIAVNSDIFTISGQSKSGKSALVGMAIAAALRADGICPDAITGLVMTPNNDGKAIIHIDTEQAAHKHKTNLMATLKRSGLERCPDNLLSYNIRRLPLELYQDKLTGICAGANSEFGGIHSIWIDGGADFVADTNDQAQSNEIIKFFEEIAIQYDTAVFLIVHTNPGTDKERGHFGSQCQRKSGGILTVKIEGDTSFVEAKLLRYAGRGDVGRLSFYYDKQLGYHIGTGTMEAPDPEKVKLEREIKKAFDLSRRILGGQTSMRYGEIIEHLTAHTGKSERTVKPLFTLMNIYKMIEKGGDERYRINNEYRLPV